MKLLLAIAAGGALGAISRYSISLLMLRLSLESFPFATLIVNVFGSFLIGFFTFYFAGKNMFNEVWQGFIMIGFLGAFTTFSTFSLQTMKLFNTGAVHLAIVNLVLTYIACIIAVYLGGGLGVLLK